MKLFNKIRASLVPLIPAALLMAAAGANAAPPQTLELWSEGAPGALGEADKDKPKIIVYLPSEAKTPAAAVVICPGGGYSHLAMNHEGHEIAKWLNSFGVAGIIVDYRHKGKGYRHPAPMQDVQRALRTVRAHAAEWKIDPNRVGVLGFSAGGHLASTAATHFDNGDPDADNAIDRQSCRPDFAVLCYGVLTLGEPFSHGGSQRSLLGNDASDDLVRSLSNEKQVTAETPPTFLWHTDEDRGVPPQNSVMFYLACKQHGVPAELHVFEKGRHGVGLGKGITGTEQWSKLCRLWMQNRGVITPAE